MKSDRRRNMTRDSLKKKIKEAGLLGSVLYYLARFSSKAEMYTVGKWAAKHQKLQDRIVFKNRQNQDFTDNARALFEYLAANGYNKKFEIIWMVSNKKEFKEKSHSYKNVKFVTAENKYGWNSPAAYYYGATAKYFFYTNHSADLNRFHCQGQVTVNLWHGCGYKGSTLDKKDIPHSDTMGYFDYALVPGPVFVKAKASYWHCDPSKILPLGYPRYDWMLHPSLTKKEALERLFGDSFPTKEKTVIWMPTFRKSTQQGYGENEIELPFQLPALEGKEELEELDAFLRDRHLQLLIKKHPLQIGWEEQEEGFTNIRYVSDALLKEKEVQLYELTGLMDGLISDYSSIAVDYMLLERPLGFVLTDYESYREKRGFVFENPLDYMPGEKIYNLKDLKNFLAQVAEGTDTYREKRSALLPRMHTRAENYCENIVKTLIEETGGKK